MELEINVKLSSLARGAPGVGSGPEAGAGAEVSERMVALSEMFGVGLDERHELELYRGFRLRIRGGDVVYITGASGCGKSVLLRAIGAELRRRVGTGPSTALGTCGELVVGDPAGPVAELGEVDAGGRSPVIDRLPGSLEEALRVASVAGLNDAFLLLRPPGELSDGQRYRWRLAMLLARGARTILIDEFCSTLDRRTARAVAYRVRKYADRTGTTFVVATAHDDLAEDLCPDVIVRKRWAGQVEVRSVGVGAEAE